MTPFRSEKNTNWEGAFRVPCMIRWPGHIAPGHSFRTRSSAASTGSRPCSPRPAIRRQGAAAEGNDVGGKTFKVHLDGFDQLPYLTGQEPRSARNSFFYFNDDGDLVALRYENWKVVFVEQRAQGTLEVGPSRSPSYASPSSSICTPTRTSAPTSRQTLTGTG